jgi:hypothetical protein
MDDTIDLLQIKIENAKKQLSDETLNAIAAVPWQGEILKMRETKGYSFEQLGDLELETELLLCGLLAPGDYPKELENRMKISRGVANELVKEMNELVFSKIKEELIKNSERKKIFAENSPPLLDKEGNEERFLENSPHPDPLLVKERENKPDTEAEKKSNRQVLNSAGIEIINGNGKETVHPILAQKLSDSVQSQVVKTEHTLENITKTNPPASVDTKIDIPKVDPYREIPE